MSEWRDAADDEAGGLARLLGVGSPQAGESHDGRQPPDVDAVGAARQRHDRLKAVLGGCHEDEALDDLTELRADGRGGIRGGVGGLAEEHDLQRDALSLGGVVDALVSGV